LIAVTSSVGQSNILLSIVETSIRYPRNVLLVWLSIAVIASYFIVDLRIDTTMGSALNRTDQSWRDYERSLELHGGDEFVAVALAPSDEPFSVESLSAILDMTDQLE
jgi:predicted RND superfamily exporter protein